jgi:hypothetical protein
MPGPADEAQIRAQLEQTLRRMLLATVVGLIVIVILAAAISSARSVLILAGIVWLCGSLGAQWYLRRRFLSHLKTP